jgi:hypothetical protein
MEYLYIIFELPLQTVHPFSLSFSLSTKLFIHFSLSFFYEEMVEELCHENLDLILALVE